MPADRRALLVRVLLGLGAIGLLWWVGSCAYHVYFLGDEGKIRRRILDMAAALEEPDVGDFMDGIAEDYGVSGRSSGIGPRDLDREALKRYLQGRVVTMGSDRFVIYCGPIAVDLADDRSEAEARFHASVLEGVDPSSLDISPTDGRLWQVRLHLVLEEGEWKVDRHHLEDARDAALEELRRP